MKLEKLLKETDSLTYINALKVTQTEIKDKVSRVEELGGYMQNEFDAIKKLMRRADNQYRVIAKIVQGSTDNLSTNVEVETDLDAIREIMEDVR